MEAEDYWREFAYTTWEASCRDPAIIHGDLRNCRRGRGHSGSHASGFGPYLSLWENL